jgi:hypothetical protein
VETLANIHQPIREVLRQYSQNLAIGKEKTGAWSRKENHNK